MAQAGQGPTNDLRLRRSKQRGGGWYYASQCTLRTLEFYLGWRTKSLDPSSKYYESNKRELVELGEWVEFRKKFPPESNGWDGMRDGHYTTTPPVTTEIVYYD